MRLVDLPRRVVLPALAVASCLPPAGCARAFRAQPAAHYIQIADALTSPSLAQAIRVAPVQMAPFQFTAACRTATPITRFELMPATLEMVVGGRYALDTLSVVAINAADLTVPDIPFAIEAEETSASVIALRTDDPDVRGGVLRALAPGNFRVRIRTTCGMPYVERILLGRVVHN